MILEQMLKGLSERKPPAKVEAKMHMVTVEQKIQELEKFIETVKFALFQGFYKKFDHGTSFAVYILAALELSKGIVSGSSNRKSTVPFGYTAATSRLSFTHPNSRLSD